VSEFITPRELNKRIKSGETFWVAFDDARAARVLKVRVRNGNVEASTWTGWVKTGQVGRKGKLFTVSNDAKGKK